MEGYLQHLKICNKMQDWTEAQTALSECPNGPDKIFAYDEMQIKMNTCTCGLKEIVEALRQLPTDEEIKSYAAKATIPAKGRENMKGVGELFMMQIGM